MSLPGFTGEASLYMTNEKYREYHLPKVDHISVSPATTGPYTLCYSTQAEMALALWGLSTSICPGYSNVKAGQNPNTGFWCITWNCP